MKTIRVLIAACVFALALNAQVAEKPVAEPKPVAKSTEAVAPTITPLPPELMVKFLRARGEVSEARAAKLDAEEKTSKDLADKSTEFNRLIAQEIQPWCASKGLVAMGVEQQDVPALKGADVKPNEAVCKPAPKKY